MNHSGQRSPVFLLSSRAFEAPRAAPGDAGEQVQRPPARASAAERSPAWRAGAPALNRSLRTGMAAYGALAALLGWLLWRAMDPGGLTTDSFFQLEQAQGRRPYNDWHPVIMSWNWARLLDLTGAVGSMAAVQVLLATGGSALLVYYLLVSTRSIPLGALGLAPLVLPNTAGMWGIVWKDVQMALALLLCVVLTMLIRARPRAAWPLAALAAGFLIYGVLVRKNAAVVAIPLLMLGCLQLLRTRGAVLSARRYALTVAASFAALCALVAAGSAAMSAATHPERTSQVSQVMLDDIVFAVPAEAVVASSAPDWMKDKILAAKELCARKGRIWDAYWSCYGKGAQGESFTAIRDPAALQALWAQEIPAHLPEYAAYRFRTTGEFLSTSTLITVDPQQATEYGLGPTAPEARAGLDGYVLWAATWLPFLFRGWFALVVCAAGLAVAALRRTRSVSAALICASGITYLLTFVPAAPAANYRYVFWSMLAGLLGWIVLLGERRARALRGAPPTVIGKDGAGGQPVWFALRRTGRAIGKRSAQSDSPS